MKVGLARPCSLKNGFHKGRSLGPRDGPNCVVPPFGDTCDGGGPSAMTVLDGGGPAGGEKDDGTDATAEGRGGTGGTFGGSASTFLGIDPSAFAGTTPGCWKLVKPLVNELLATYRRPLFRSTNFEYIYLMLSVMWSYETIAQLAIGAQIHDFIAGEATDTRIERRYVLGA